MSHPHRKLGRRPRGRNQSIAHYSSLVAGTAALPPIPDAHSWTVGMPADFGALCNATDPDNPQQPPLGCCTASGLGHIAQVVTFNAQGKEAVVRDADTLKLYEAMGYVPGDNSTDRGCMEQDVLSYVHRNGIPTSDGPLAVSAFVEVDPRVLADIERTIYECGAAYLGMRVPRSMMQDPLPAVFHDYSHLTDDGHCVILTGYDRAKRLFEMVTWGLKKPATYEFVGATVDEVYGVVLPAWVTAKGTTPANVPMADLLAAMSTMTA